MSAELFDKLSLKTEELEANKKKITFAVSPERLREGVVHAYNKTKSKFNIPGFRKGKAPRQIIEMQYGKEIFYPDAVDHLLDEAYEAVMEEAGIDVAGRPEADVESMSVEEGVVFIIEVYTRPKAKVGKYKKLTYTEPDLSATDEEIDERITQARERNSRLVSAPDHVAAIDDVVTLDYEGSIDGVPFDGGKGENFDLTLGSNTFIAGFEDQLVGAVIDEERDVNVSFPEEYHAPELAGKPAVFKCVIKDIRRKELPELNDDFAQDVSEFDTFAEYRESVVKEVA
ncbi:MAG: trigger factor, partial [Defluviitaleaceae bacterium]|nr:trigger factor [Defluviitaleaceae bacterium]